MEEVCVEVIAKVRKNGVIIPGVIIWDVGQEYKIDKIMDACRLKALKSIQDGKQMRFYLWY